MCFVKKQLNYQKMILCCIFVLFFLKCCSSNDFECGYSDNEMESIEFYCTNYEGTVPVNCSMTFLSTFQTYNKSKVTQLKVGGCDPDKIHQFIEDFPNLHSLDISFSGITTLDSFNLKHKQLVKVNASFNLLSEIPRKFFAHIINVTEVDFSHNSLNGIIDLPENLLYIDLSHTKIGSIYQDFNDLSNVQHFQLKILRIEGNPIRMFDWKILPLVKSGFSLYISWKKIKEFKIWNYVDKPIRVVTNSQEEGLLHASNGRIELHCKENSFKNIKRFELIDNSVENPTEIIKCLTPTIEYLTLSGEFDEKFNSTSLSRLNNLKELCLHEAQLTEFDFSILKYVTKIEWLDISQNNLERVSNISFLENAKNLIHLNLGENELESTPELIQYLSASVTTLNLAGNFFGKINAETFEKLTNLQYLYLANTSLLLENLKPFESLKKLRTLVISFNNLENSNFTSQSASLEELRIFQAVNCKVKNASELITLFENSGFLSKLDISGNCLGELTVETLNNFKELQYLNLKNMNLTKIDFGILGQKQKLQFLDLSCNQLESINFASVLSNLESINLEQNNLREIEYFTNSHFPQLGTLDISSNQFSCEYLDEFIPQLKKEWPHIKIINNPWEQQFFKCHPKN